jgi:hypothetical protein
MTEPPPLSRLPQDFSDLLVALADAGAQFVVVGSHALARHGYVRATLDLDVLVRPTRENARRVMAALAAFGAPLSAHGVREEDLATPGTVYQVGVPPTRIDVLTSISGVGFDEAWETRVVGVIEGRAVPFLGREALLRNKRAAGRPKDLHDADELEATERP